MNELATLIHETNADSLSPLLINSEAESRFWDASRWSASLKSTLYITIGLVILLVFTYMVHMWLRTKTLRFQKEFETFALKHQDSRQLPEPISHFEETPV